MKRFNSGFLIAGLGLLSLGYAIVITFLNVTHIRAMPAETRVMLSSLQPLVAASEPVVIAETNIGSPDADSGLVKGDVSVAYGRQKFPASTGVWINPSLPHGDPGRYLHRMRAGVLRDKVSGADLESVFLVEVLQNFNQHGDEVLVNLWRFPFQQQSDGASITDAVSEARFAGRVSLDEAGNDPGWRAVFASSHARVVRAFPALAALLISLAAFGSLLFTLWREQPWAVTATTVTFALPIVSAAPFLTAFGWVPILAAVILGFIMTVALACAVEQRLVPVVRARFQTRVGRRLLEGGLVPGFALMAGTTLVVSLASVSVIPWQGLGSGSPGDIFVESLIRPAVGLLLGGTGGALLLTLFHLVLNWRNHRQDHAVADID